MEIGDVGNFGAYLSGFYWGTLREQIIPIEHDAKEVVLRQLKGSVRDYPAFDVVVKDKASGGQLTHTRLYITPDGEALVHGPYTKEVHAGLSKVGIKRPTAYYIDAKKFQFLPDEILYGEFDNLFLETPRGIQYQPAKFYFYSPDSKSFFTRVASRFCGDDVTPDRGGFQERWRGSDKNPWLRRLGDCQMVKGSIKLRGGFELEPDGTFQNWCHNPQFFRPEEKISPPQFHEGEMVVVETKGQAAPRSIEAKTTHRLFHIKGTAGQVTTIAQEISRTVYDGVHTFLITHPHADHLDPLTMLKQLEHNKGKGTTLILGEEAKPGVLQTIAEYDDWDSTSSKSAGQFLADKYKVRVVSAVTVGNIVVRATPDVMGAHGVVVSGVGIFQRVLVLDPKNPAFVDQLLYYDPSDGDYNIDSLQKQIRALEGKTTPTSAETDQLNRLKKVKEYLLQARYVTVDQGTTGYDTHGTVQTTENLRRERLKAKFRMPDDKARAFSVAFSQDGREGALRALRKLQWEDDATQMRIVDELEAVTDTSHLGAGGEKRNVPEYREGRVERIRVDGSRHIELPRIQQALQKVGLELIEPFNSSLLEDPDFLHIEVDGVTFHAKNQKDVPQKLGSLMRDYSPTLNQMTVTEGRQTRLVGEWLRQKGIYVVTKTAGRPVKTPLGYYDLPQRSTVPGLRNRMTYRLADGIKAGLSRLADPKTAYYSKSVVGGVLKYGGPALMAGCLMSVIYTNWKGLEYGDAEAIAEVLATVAGFGLSFWVFGIDLAATAIITGVDSVYALPLSTGFHWLTKQGLTWGIRKIQYVI